jgi:hypothetical protein
MSYQMLTRCPADVCQMYTRQILPDREEAQILPDAYQMSTRCLPDVYQILPDR